MKVLVFGPSGSGKTFIARWLRESGQDAFDADEIDGLSAWYNRYGDKVPAPAKADEALQSQYSFLWNKKFLDGFQPFSEVYIFGGSGNLFDVLDLFDKVYFLKVEEQLQLERLRNPDRPDPLMDRNEKGEVIWGAWLEQEAAKRGLPFIDASLTPEQVWSIIQQP